MVRHIPTDVLGSITYNGFATGFRPTTPFAVAGTWVPPPSYFFARGTPPFVPMGPPPQMGSHTAAEAGPSHVGTPFPTGTSSAIALSPCNIDSIPLLTLIEFLSFACAGYVDASYQYDNGGEFQLEDL